MRLLINTLKPVVEKFPALAQFYRYRRDYKKVKDAPDFRPALGFRFSGSDDMEDGTFEPHETSIFEKIIDHAEMFVNIGANTGYYSLKALQKGKDVLAFEPNEINIKILLRNVRANDFEAAFHLLPMALSDTVGVLPMYGGGTGASLIEGWDDQQNFNLVPVNRFDNVAAEIVRGRACFVLIDVEGAELFCLQGASTLLGSSDQTVFMVEIAVGDHQPNGVDVNPNLEETFGLFFSAGYLAFTAGAEVREVSVEEVAKIASTGQDSLGTRNFLFLKDPKQIGAFGL